MKMVLILAGISPEQKTSQIKLLNLVVGESVTIQQLDATCLNHQLVNI